MRQCLCIICQAPIIRGTLWLHLQCARGKDYDLTVPFAQWPAWARWLKANEQRQRRDPWEVVSLDAMMERYEED